MTTTEIEVHQPKRTQTGLPARIQYARELANSGLLPTAYRRNPANVLWAMEYGDMLGLSPMAAITGVHVIEGATTASAGLISALVRQAGHRLRVRGDNKSATCEIVRADDPGYTFSVTWTLRKNGDSNPSAEDAGLLNKGTWKNYPASMLKSRAITQCARDACEEALYGLHYTPEEMGAEVDEEGQIVGEAVPAQPERSAEQGNDAAAANAEVIEDIWVTPEGGEDWIQQATALAAALTDKDAARVLYQQAVAKEQAGEITKAQRNDLCNLITAQMEFLEQEAEPVEGTIAPPDGDPWESKVEEITTAGDAEKAIAELDQAHTDGHVDSRRHKALRAAMSAKGGSRQGAAA